MAGKIIRKIICWELKIEGLHIYLASTKKGALRIGLTLRRKSDCVDFFRGIFPEASFSKAQRPNLFLIRAIKNSVHQKQPPTTPDLDISCTAFQRRVLEAIRGIPFGETRTYGEVARMIGKPEAPRAVGQALGRNPLPLIFP